MKKMTTLAAAAVAGSLFLAGGAVAEMGSGGQKDVQQKSGQSGQFGQQAEQGQQSYGQQPSATMGQQQADQGQQQAQQLSQSEVKQIQQRLQASGHDPGPIDGIWGPKTSQALQQFQQSWGLAATGQPTDQSLQVLGVQPGQQGQEFIGVSPTFEEDQRQQQQQQQQQQDLQREQDRLQQDRQLDQDRPDRSQPDTQLR
ncbi:MAG: peptidoglycan-binding domain-containing protein [Desulfuromonadales bacterium]